MIQFFLGGLDVLISATVKLQLNEISGQFPEANHPPDTLFGGGGNLYRNPFAVLHKVQLAADLRVAEIPGFQIGGFHPF